MAATDVDALVREVLAGNSDAYEEVVDLLQQDVWRIVALGRFDLHTATDLVQQAFVEAYLHLARYQPGTDFAAWLKAIARNLVRKEMRGRKSERLHLVTFHKHLASCLDDAAAPALDRRVEALRECRKRLPPEYERLLALHYGDGMDLSALSRAMGRSLVAVKQMLWRGRNMLRLCLKRKVAAS